MDNMDKQIIVENTLNSLVMLWSGVPSESERSCAIDCCIGNIRFLENLLANSDQAVSVVGIKGLERIRQFDEDILDFAMECDDNEESPEWRDIQDFVRVTIDHIKQAMSAHQSTKPKKYSLEYTNQFMKREIKNIAYAKRFSKSDFYAFIPRCRFILDNPDEYMGITYEIFKELELLYALIFTFKAKMPYYDSKIEDLLAQTDHFKEITQLAQKILDLFGKQGLVSGE